MHCILIRNSQFTRGTQEDSHEALRCIFHALKEEEIQVHMLFSAKELAIVLNNSFIFVCMSANM